MAEVLQLQCGKPFLCCPGDIIFSLVFSDTVLDLPASCSTASSDVEAGDLYLSLISLLCPPVSVFSLCLIPSHQCDITEGTVGKTCTPGSQ